MANCEPGGPRTGRGSVDTAGLIVFHWVALVGDSDDRCLNDH